MSDFLSYLAGRQQGTSETLRPLVSPLFAQDDVAAGAAETWGELPGFEELDIEREAAPAARKPTPPVPAPGAPSPQPVREPVVAEASRPAERASRHEEPRPPEVPARAEDGAEVAPPERSAWVVEHRSVVRTEPPSEGARETHVPPAAPVRAPAEHRPGEARTEVLPRVERQSSDGLEPVRREWVLRDEVETVPSPVSAREPRFVHEVAPRPELEQGVSPMTPTLATRAASEPRAEAAPGPRPSHGQSQARGLSSLLSRVDVMVERRESARRSVEPRVSRLVTEIDEGPERGPLALREAPMPSMQLEPALKSKPSPQRAEEPRLPRREADVTVAEPRVARGRPEAGEGVPAPRDGARPVSRTAEQPAQARLEVRQAPASPVPDAAEASRDAGEPPPPKVATARREEESGSRPRGAGEERVRPTAVQEAERPAHRTTTGAAREVPSAQPAPVVNVTIGRIEVRAVGAPAQPPRRAAAPPARPALGLDEYLRRRNGGGT